ncbi:MAG: DUF5719 family protein [Actinomycetes bacterium]
MTRPLQSLLTVLAVLVAVSGLALLTRPGQDRLEPAGVVSRVPVTQASVACPDPRRTGDDYDVQVHSVTPSTDVEDLPSGEATVAALEPGGEDVLSTVRERDRITTTTQQSGSAPALTVRASQSLAPGLAAEQHSLIPDGDMRGLAATACPAPGTDSWFVGGGSEVGQRSTVLLTNTEPAPAQVDVTLFGEDGPLEASGGRGVVVGARQQEVLRIDALAPGADVTAVHVEATTGRVASAVHDTEVDGLTPRGTDWVPSAGAPRRTMLLPGMVEGAGLRRLHLLAPGETDAVVQLEVITPERTFVPTGQEVVQVPARRVKSVDLTKVLAGEPAAIRLKSDVPMLAGAESRTGNETGTADVAYSAPTPALAGPVTTLGNASDDVATSALYLTAPKSTGTVEVTTLPANGKPTTKRVKVPGQTTVRVALKGKGTFGAVVTPQPGSGPVHAARVLSHDAPGAPLLTVQALRTLPVTVAVPEVAADQSSGLYG